MTNPPELEWWELPLLLGVVVVGMFLRTGAYRWLWQRGGGRNRVAKYRKKKRT